MSSDLQILSHIEDAERRFDCEIERIAALIFIREARAQYRPDVAFESMIESVIGEEPDVSAAQRHAYKYVIGKVFAARRTRRAGRDS